MPALPDRIGDYDIEAELGSGGFATVYRARHTILDTVHAIKLLDPGLRANPDARRRFLDEAKIQAKHLDHPNVVKVITVIATAEHAALVMELIEGPNLEAYLGELTHRPEEITRIMLGVLGGVGDAHAVGIIHRDLKPANVLLQKKAGQLIPKVTDFGIAKVLSDVAGKGKTSTHGSTRMGTLRYMSPEQVRRAKDVTPRSDIFSLGAMLYELATGQAPFRGDSDYEVMENVVNGRYPPPANVRPDIDKVLADVIGKALDSDPFKRFSSCAEFEAALRGAAGRQCAELGEPQAAPRPLLQSARTASEPSDPRVAEPASVLHPFRNGATIVPWYSKRRLWLSVGLVGALAVSSVALLFVASSGTQAARNLPALQEDGGSGIREGAPLAGPAGPRTDEYGRASAQLAVLRAQLDRAKLVADDPLATQITTKIHAQEQVAAAAANRIVDEARLRFLEEGNSLHLRQMARGLDLQGASAAGSYIRDLADRLERGGRLPSPPSSVVLVSDGDLGLATSLRDRSDVTDVVAAFARLGAEREHLRRAAAVDIQDGVVPDRLIAEDALHRNAIDVARRLARDRATAAKRLYTEDGSDEHLLTLSLLLRLAGDFEIAQRLCAQLKRPAPPDMSIALDADRDGVVLCQDECPNDAEDPDGIRDQDGCPEADADNDGVPDAQDRCPIDAEDVDDYMDTDGCPDSDNDGDGIVDKEDACPNDPETPNTFKDKDGCPDRVEYCFRHPDESVADSTCHSTRRECEADTTRNTVDGRLPCVVYGR